MRKPEPSEKLAMITLLLKARREILLARIDFAELSGKLSTEKAKELRKALR
jgi:hypothetical protein